MAIPGMEQLAAGAVEGVVKAPLEAVKSVAETGKVIADTYIALRGEAREQGKYNMQVNKEFAKVVSDFPNGISNVPAKVNFPKLSLYGETLDSMVPPFKVSSSVTVTTAYFYHTRVKVRSLASLIEKPKGGYSTSKREESYATKITEAKKAHKEPDKRLLKGLVNLAFYQPIQFTFDRVVLDVDVLDKTVANIKAAIEADRKAAKGAWGAGGLKLLESIQDRANAQADKYFERLNNLTKNHAGGWTQISEKERRKFIKNNEDLLGKDLVKKYMDTASDALDEQTGKKIMKDELGRVIRKEVMVRMSLDGATVYELDAQGQRAWVDKKEDIWNRLPDELNRKFDLAISDVDAWAKTVKTNFGKKAYISGLKVISQNKHLGRGRKCDKTALNILEAEVTPMPMAKRPHIKMSMNWRVEARKGKSATKIDKGGDFSLYSSGEIFDASAGLGERLQKFAIVKK